MSKPRVASRKTSVEAKHVGANAFNIDAVLDVNQRSVDAMTRMNVQICQSLIRVNAELVNFANRRLTADCVVAQKLTSAAVRPQDAIDALLDFQKKIVADYAAEAHELVTMCTSVAGNVIHDVGADTGFADVDGPAEKSDSVTGDMSASHGAGEALGTSIACRAIPRPQAAEIDDRAAANGPVITFKASRSKSSTPDVQMAILRVLSGSDKALALTEIAQQIETLHYAALIRPIRSLCAMGRVAKVDNAYHLVS